MNELPPPKKFKRPPRRPQPSGWSAAETADLLQISTRRINYYTYQGIFVAPKFYGPHTRYQRPELLRLIAIGELRKREGLSLEQVKHRLTRMSDAEVMEYVLPLVTDPAVLAALGVDPPAPAATPAPTEPEEQGPPEVAGEAWRIFELLPGLRLSLRADASALAQRLAKDFHAQARRAIDR